MKLSCCRAVSGAPSVFPAFCTPVLVPAASRSLVVGWLGDPGWLTPLTTSFLLPYDVQAFPAKA